MEFLFVREIQKVLLKKLVIYLIIIIKLLMKLKKIRFLLKNIFTVS